MATTVSLSQDTLAVEPGSAVTTELRVRNTGDVVDQFNFQPLGDAAKWIKVEPPSVRLFPNTDESVTITIAPPRSPDSEPGQTAWAVKAIPSEDPAGAAVAEGTVDVAEFSVIEAELQPVAGRGRLVGRYEIAVDNRGNIPMQVRLTGTDAEQALAYEFADDIVATEPGAAHFTKLKLRPGQRIWRGQPKSHSFQILVEPQGRAGAAKAGQGDDPEPAHGAAPGGAVAVAEAPTIQSTLLTGTLLQEPVLPKWLWKAVLALLALLLLLFILWKTLLKPQVESAARAVAVEEVEDVGVQVAELESEVDDVAEEAEVAQEAAVEAEEAAAAAEEAADDAAAGGGGGGQSGLGTIFNETSAPSHSRLTVVAGPGELGRSEAGALPENETFALTDVILQNPGGAVGRIRIQLGGETILESAMENFRDLDFHFVSPYIVNGGQELALEIDCAADQVIDGTPCDAAVSFAGFTTETTESS